ncbi:hypothetical protein OH77DRAFT_1420389 [Trametes cingulata]|nr:hypothetical protein OH77DRAFT_1420389 [Trametes cingulata]
MSESIPLSPSFASLATAQASTAESEEMPATPKVRFDQDCVLIPDPLPTSRLPRLVTKSYSLPLWKRKQREPSVVSDSEDDPAAEDHVVFKVSVPSLTTKARSPSRSESAHRPLVPCLVHSPDPSTANASSSSLSSSPRPTRPRGASLPQPVQSDAVTVPLRSCCTQCYLSIDKCMQEGDHWKVHFSKGAARRRKSVSDAHAPAPPRPSRHCLKDAMPGFDAVIAVDEVDRRRRSTDFDALTAFTLEMPSSSSRAADPDDIPLRRALSLPGETHPMRAPAMSSIFTAPRPAAPPIPEEDEHRPSPRRTPIPSPLGSSTNLPATCIVHTTVQTTLIQRLTASPSPSPSPSPPITAPLPTTALPEKAALETPLPASPPAFEKEMSNYFSVPYQPSTPLHDRYVSDSPMSSPSSSPRIEHATPAGLGGQRKRSLRHIPGPGSLIREATQMLKGMSGLGGMAMTV